MLRSLSLVLLLCCPALGQVANYQLSSSSVTVEESEVFALRVQCNTTTAFPGDAVFGYQIAMEMVDVDLVNITPHSSLSADTAFFSAEVHTASATGNPVVFAALISDYGFLFSGNAYDGSGGIHDLLNANFVCLNTTTTATLSFEQTFGTVLGQPITLDQGITYSSNGLATGALLQIAPNATAWVCNVTATAAEQDFVRGDSNGDGGVNIADAITNLVWLFPNSSSMTVIECLDAADMNDDGDVNIADSVSLLSYLFGGSGPAPPSPFPSCGNDPTTDTLDCDLGPCP